MSEDRRLKCKNHEKIKITEVSRAFFIDNRNRLPVKKPYKGCEEI